MMSNSLTFKDTNISDLQYSAGVVSLGHFVMRGGHVMTIDGLS
jgi:hypothetical protein